MHFFFVNEIQLGFENKVSNSLGYLATAFVFV